MSHKSHLVKTKNLRKSDIYFDLRSSSVVRHFKSMYMYMSHKSHLVKTKNLRESDIYFDLRSSSVVPNFKSMYMYMPHKIEIVLIKRKAMRIALLGNEQCK